MKLRFFKLDVFTDTPLKGNALAVFPNAEGLSGETMQAIAAEMNLSETVFVLPSEVALRRLRIFTPRQELPLAGHPVVGTWNLLSKLGVTERSEAGKITVMQELGVGILPVEIDFRNSEPISVTMTQGEFKQGEPISAEDQVADLARALGLEPSDLVRSFPTRTCSTGIRALVVPVTSLSALKKINVDAGTLTKIYREQEAIGCYVFTLETIEKESLAHARFFAPDDGIVEDAATGSAAGALAGYLLSGGACVEGDYIVEQGDFMRRPSRITVSPRGGMGDVREVKVGGQAVIVAEGDFFI